MVEELKQHSSIWFSRPSSLCSTWNIFHFLSLTAHVLSVFHKELHLEVVFPTQVFLNPKPRFFGYFLLPETRFFITTKPG